MVDWAKSLRLEIEVNGADPDLMNGAADWIERLEGLIITAMPSLIEARDCDEMDGEKVDFPADTAPGADGESSDGA